MLDERKCFAIVEIIFQKGFGSFLEVLARSSSWQQRKNKKVAQRVVMWNLYEA